MRAVMKSQHCKGSASLRLLFLSLFILCGCAGTESKGRLVQLESGSIGNEVMEMEKKYYATHVIDNYNALVGDPVHQKTYRDEVINGRIYVIDYYYNKFKNDISDKDEPRTNIVTDIAVLGLDAAEAMNPARRVKEILLAISGGAVGTQTDEEREMFYDESLPALVSKMDSLRLQQLVLIRQRMKYATQGDYAYTLGAALIDVNDYFQAGTLSGALVEIMNSSGASSKEARTELRELTGNGVETRKQQQPVRED